MPTDYDRLEVRLPTELLTKLDALTLEVFQRTGNKPTRSELVREMVQLFFDKQDWSCILPSKE